MIKSGIKIICVVLLLIFSLGLNAQDEGFSISKNITKSNGSPAVAIDHKGNAVVVWSNEDTSKFASKIYAAFLKYKKSSGSYAVKKARVISVGSENNYSPTVVYNEETKSFYCSWVRSLPSGLAGNELVIRKLNARGKPLGDVAVLHSDKLKRVFEPRLLRFHGDQNVSNAAPDKEFVIFYYVFNSKKKSRQTNEIWVAGLAENPTALLAAKRVISSKAKSFSDYFKIGDFVSLVDGSFLLSYEAFDAKGHDVKVVKISPEFKSLKERGFGKCLMDIYRLCVTSSGYGILTTVVSDSGDYLTLNQPLTADLDHHNSSYQPDDSFTISWPAITSLEKGGAVQLLSAAGGRLAGFLLNDKGEMDREFNVDQIKDISANNVLVEIPGKNKVFLVYTGPASKGNQPVMGAVFDLPEN